MYESEAKSKTNADKLAKQLEMQIADTMAKADEQARQLAEMASQKSRLLGENSDLNRQLEDAEAQLNATQRLRQQLQSQVEDGKRALDDEIKVGSAFSTEVNLTLIAAFLIGKASSPLASEDAPARVPATPRAARRGD